LHGIDQLFLGHAMATPSRISVFVLSLLLGLGSSTLAHADDDEGSSWWEWGKSEKHNERGEGRSGLADNTPAQVKQECGTCHMTYPAGLLPAGSSQHLMTNLGHHFGNDASLDADTASTITQYLTSNAGTYKRVSEMPPNDRITESYWFSRKHNKHVSADTWTRPSIGSRSNCAACHAGAEQGNFNEHSVRIPG